MSTRRVCAGFRRTAIALCAAGLLGMAWPGALPLADAPPRLAQAEERIGLEEAIQRVRQQSGGKVLRAETKRGKGRTVHRVRVLSDDGRVRTYEVDAATGRISG